MLVADGQGSVRRNEGTRRRHREGHAAADQVRRHLLRSRRPHRRQCRLPRRRHLHHPPDVEGDPRARRSRTRGPRRRRMEAARRRDARLRQAVADARRARRSRSCSSAARTPAAISASSLPRQKILFLSEIVPEPRVPGDAIGLSDRMAQGAGPRGGDAGGPLHRRPRVHRDRRRSRKRSCAPITRRWRR